MRPFLLNGDEGLVVNLVFADHREIAGGVAAGGFLRIRFAHLHLHGVRPDLFQIAVDIEKNPGIPILLDPRGEALVQSLVFQFQVEMAELSFCVQAVDILFTVSPFPGVGWDRLFLPVDEKGSAALGMEAQAKRPGRRGDHPIFQRRVFQFYRSRSVAPNEAPAAKGLQPTARGKATGDLKKRLGELGNDQ